MSFWLRKCVLLLPLLVLMGCAGEADFRPVNKQGQGITKDSVYTAQPPATDDTMVALAFSGGGTRASAFSYGVLKSLSQTPGSDGESLLHKVDFVSGVSGGSVTAAYFALKGPDGFSDFREAFLDKNAEQGLQTEISLSNILRVVTFGGVNDRSGLPVWLDDNVFHDATYADIFKKDHPILWISASDIFNRTPFVFTDTSFAPLCSDLSQLKLSQAVAASAAVPGAFTPVNLESFAGTCDWEEPTWSTRGDLYYSQKAMLEAFRHYRNTKEVKYIKLLDGGLTDNFGVGGVTLARLEEGKKYAPLSEEQAIKLKRLLFIVVNAGRSPVKGEWNRRPDNPSIITLAEAVTDTAIDANTRTTYDLFKIVMRQWEQDLINWRCTLPEASQVEARRKNKHWKCDDMHFYVTQVSFEDAGAERRAKLDNIPTRFTLPREDIDYLIESADLALKHNATFATFTESLAK